MGSYTKSHTDVKYSIENILNKIVITMYGVRRVLDYLGDHLVIYINVSSLSDHYVVHLQLI